MSASDSGHLPIERLVVLYDETCRLCQHCRDWLSSQETLVPLDFVPAGSPFARRHFGHLPLRRQLVVVSNSGDIWMDGPAFIMCLWATKEWHSWSFRMSSGALEPLAKRFFHTLSTHRGRIGALLGPTECTDDRCDV